MRLSSIFIIFFALISNSYNALALDYQSPRTLSLARGGRAGALLTDTVTLNPSLLGFYPVAALSGSLFWFNPRVDSGLFHASVIDGTNPLFSAGFAFTRTNYMDVIHLSVAKKISQMFSVGAHGKRFATRSNSLAARGSSFASFDGGVSVTAVLSPLPIQVALTSDNLNNAEKYESWIGPREYAAAVKANLNDILIGYGDYVQKHSHGGFSPSYSGGAELALGEGFFLRGGLFGFSEKGWSAGGGWLGPKIGFNYGYQKQQSPKPQTLQAVSVDIFM